MQSRVWGSMYSLVKTVKADTLTLQEPQTQQETDTLQVPQDNSWLDNLIKYPDLPHPGNPTSIKGEARDILTLNTFDGAKFDMAKPLVMPSAEKQFHYVHRLSLGSVKTKQNHSYEFETMLSLGHDFVIGAVIDLQRTVSGRISKNWGKTGLSTGVQFQSPSAPNPAFALCEVSWKSRDSTTGLQMQGGTLSFSHIQSISRPLRLGTEIALPMGQLPIYSLFGEYTTPREVITVNTTKLQGIQLDLTYFRNVTAQFGVATSAHINMLSQESQFSTGFRLVPNEEMALKANIDGTGKVTMVFSQFVMKIFQLMFSGELDHAKTDYKFGFQIAVG